MSLDASGVRDGGGCIGSSASPNAEPWPERAWAVRKSCNQRLLRESLGHALRPLPFPRNPSRPSATR